MRCVISRVAICDSARSEVENRIGDMPFGVSVSLPSGLHAGRFTAWLYVRLVSGSWQVEPETPHVETDEQSSSPPNSESPKRSPCPRSPWTLGDEPLTLFEPEAQNPGPRLTIPETHSIPGSLDSVHKQQDVRCPEGTQKPRDPGPTLGRTIIGSIGASRLIG